MNSETRQCQNCKQPFVIEPGDFEFYKKMNVPPPTFCFDCRLQRRMTFRNERTLFKRKCNVPGHTEDIISVYHPAAPVVVYDEKYWWSDAWNPVDYGASYDFSKPFFTQYGELLRRVPLIALSVTNMSNCSYCNVAEGDKDCYLISATLRNERVLYANRVVLSKDSLDLYISDRNELCYDCVSCKGCYRVFFSMNSTDCLDSSFLYECMNCRDCFGCTNLRNKQYCFFNEQCTKEEYIQKRATFDLGSAVAIERARVAYRERTNSSLHRFARILKSVNCTGDNIVNAKNCRHCFDLLGELSPVENVRFAFWGGYGANDALDSGPGLGGGAEQMYEVFDSGIQSSNLLFTGVVYGSYDVRYSINCHGSHHLFGCYGLRSKEYCILNKQYTKEEYELLIPRIIDHMNTMPYMDKEGRVYKYGEFFPVETSPFAYNESIAYDYFPLKRDQAVERGLLWREPDVREYSITIKPNDIPDNIRDVPESIVDEVIGCAHEGECTDRCATAFKITSEEFHLYHQLGLAIPHLCPNCRHHNRLRQRNPLKLWHRKCQCAGGASENGAYKNTIVHTHHGTGHCSNEFETSYAPERKEVVYCEQCYQAEVV